MRRRASAPTPVTFFSWIGLGLAAFASSAAGAAEPDPSERAEELSTRQDVAELGRRDPASIAGAQPAESASEPKPPSWDALRNGAAPAALDVADPPAPEALLATSGASDRTSVSATAISVPQGSGTIQGMGESFSAQLSTGVATFNVPFDLPAPRGKVGVDLALAYSSGSGLGVAGLGWELGVSFIARQTDRGLPRYRDPSGFRHDQDRFVFNQGQELVPICVVGDPAFDCVPSRLAPGEILPVWTASGTAYFRPRVEGSFLRFFWEPNRLTWRVQNKSGVTLEFGVPLDGSGDTNGLERNPDAPSEIYRFYQVREYDAYGDANPVAGPPQPLNLAVYRYREDGGKLYLSDIFDTPPAADATNRDLTRFAHHTRLTYEPRTDPTQSYRSGWKIEQRLRLSRVDVSSKTFNAGVNGPRRRVRSYVLAYVPDSHTSLLGSVALQGRCAGSEEQAPTESEGAAPLDSGCSSLPPLTFAYAHVTPEGCSSAPRLSGYEGVDARVRELASSPPHSIDQADVDFFDVNSDALPDVLVTGPGRYGRDHGIFLNGARGAGTGFGDPQPMGILPVLGATSSTIALQNPNLVPLDLDGDGTVDLLHMPAVQTYSIYTPTFDAKAGWAWTGREIRTASGQNPKIDFGRDAAETLVTDVNFDGLLDVVFSAGTELQTFFSLGRYPGGDGQFGSATQTGPRSAAISNDPVRSCLPFSGEPVRFSDKDTRLADMNGDGIPDIVRIRRGDMRYWPGRGNGTWGLGARDDCAAGSFADGRHVAMSSSPLYSDIQGSTLEIADVNGDGFSDLVQMGFTSLDLWLNVDGAGFTEKQTLCSLPENPSSTRRVRLLDVNGSGTPDVVWANAGEYRYVDLQGGTRPGLLTRVENGLGKSTDIDYTTSTAEMLGAESGSACDPQNPWASRWCSKMPTVAHLVKRVTESDNLVVAGRAPTHHVTEYSYRDPVYDGQQREFRGFRRARAKSLGDASDPSDVSDTTFLLGECVDEDPTDGVDACSLGERWRDNPREALKGLAAVSERHDESGNYLSTEQATYRLRRLYVGLDGREVRHAFESGKTTFLYDTATGAAGETGLRSATSVELERLPGFVENALAIDVPIRKSPGTAEVRHGCEPAAAGTSTCSPVDLFGNPTESRDWGCVGGNACATPDELITSFGVPGRPAGDPTGWLWRTLESYVTGSAHLRADGTPERREDTLTTFNSQGDPIETRMVLAGTLPLVRFHEGAGAAVAPAPAERSVDGTILVASNEYDPFGNLQRTRGTNRRCREVSYEGNLSRAAGVVATGYDQLPTLETVYSQGCGQGGLGAAATYDRGLGNTVLVTNFALQSTRVDYDEFGRLVAITQPDPDRPGQLSALPSLKIEYFLPRDLGGVAYSLVHEQTQDGPRPDADSYLETWTFVDGFGRPVAQLDEADVSAGDGGDWLVSELVTYDDKSAVRRKYLPFFHAGGARGFPLAFGPAAPYGSQRYDAFQRPLTSYDIDGTLTLRNAYHALAVDHFDAADLETGPHQGTPATTRSDGHGRPVALSERFHAEGAIEERRTTTAYLPTGEAEIVTRMRVGKTDAPVVRRKTYDTLGRCVVNVEPNASSAAPGGEVRALRYAYNDAGDLVGMSDARGCGANYTYDGAGRVLTEDYSPCRSDQDAYTLPDLGAATGPRGVEALYVYDAVPASPAPGLEPPPGFLGACEDCYKGQLVALYSRGSASFERFDRRGRSVEHALRVAKPGPPAAGLSARYAARWYRRTRGYDGMDRETRATTGADVPELLGADGESAVTTEYAGNGRVRRVGGSYGDLVTSIQHDADGSLRELTYGDIGRTTTHLSYDERRRLRGIQTYRAPPQLWPQSATPNTFQLLLQDEDLTYDSVGNPLEIRDWRSAAEWPDGAKPVTRSMRYDDLYRLTRIDHRYSAASDTWTPPFAAENAGDPSLLDARRGAPSPSVAFDRRILSQTFQYDWLGNTRRTDDDAHGFYDRSLGQIQNGPAAAGPYQLKSASNKGATAQPRDGSLAAEYDASGNLVRLNVERNGPCLPAGARCSQRFAYDWDELGRLARARRWDLPAASLGAPGSALPTATPSAELRYAYNALDDRVVKTSVDAAGASRHSVYVFGTLELRGVSFASDEYARSAMTELAYLVAAGQSIARLFYDDPDVPMVANARLHVFFDIDDYLGSTSAVVDKATSELVERITRQAYGGDESDYRPARWKGYREDRGFTGKEQDIELGIQYFGKRYYAPLLGRWLSPDPLSLNVPGETDLNLYAYVSGQPFRAIDAVGLAGEKIGGSSSSKGSTSDDPNSKKEAELWEAAEESGFSAASQEALSDFYTETGKSSRETMAKMMKMRQAAADASAGQGDFVGWALNSALVKLYDKASAGGEKGLPMYFVDRLPKPGTRGGLPPSGGSNMRPSSGGKAPTGGRGTPPSPQPTTAPATTKPAPQAQATTTVHGEPSHGTTKPISVGKKWRPRDIADERCRSGCERVARQIQKHVGGEIKRIKPRDGDPNLGQYRGKNLGWGHHDVVVKDGRVYDAFTGHKGESIEAFKNRWTDKGGIDFGF